jgi:signal transduction histidine kinase
VGGSGLGLAIVRQIVERHGGAVRARAASPRGLAIEIDLPAAA